MTNIAIIYHSIYGHTKLQAEAVLRGAQSVAGVQAKLHSAEEVASHLDEFDAADAIIFGCPTYMGNMSAGIKTFIEAAAKKWFTLAWKDKIAGAFTNSSSFSGDKLNTLVGLVINAMQHGMIYVGLGMMPSANKPEEMNSVTGPGPAAHNRVGSFTGAMAASFQVKPPAAPP
jgi:NAD(P)H dehydrogenase (quinone)